MGSVSKILLRDFLHLTNILLEVKMSNLQYDNYLTKLQNICTENVGEEGKPVYETMKSAIQVLFLPLSNSSLEVLTFYSFSEYVGPSHGDLKHQSVISIQYSLIRIL